MTVVCNSDGQSLPTTSGAPVIALQPGTNTSTSVRDENSAKAKKDEKEKKGHSLLTTGLKYLGNERLSRRQTQHTLGICSTMIISPLSFRYDPRDVHGQADISGAYTANSQNFPGVFWGQPTDRPTSSMALVGPFATGKTTVSEIERSHDLKYRSFLKFFLVFSCTYFRNPWSRPHQGSDCYYFRTP